MEKIYRKVDDIKNYRKLQRFRHLPPVVKRVLVADYKFIKVSVFRAVDSEENTRIVMYTQSIANYLGKTPFIKTEVVSYISYCKVRKKVFTRDPHWVLQALQDNKNYAEAIGVESMFTYRSERLKGRQLDSLRGLEKLIYSHKNVLKAVFRGLCTNRDNAYRRYFKASRGLNIGFNLHLNLSKVVGPTLLNKIITITTDINHLNTFVANHTLKSQDSTKMSELRTNKTMLKDCIQMKLMLGEPMNINWSEKRIKEEHDKAVKKVLDIKMKGMPLRKVEYKVEPPELKGIEFLKSNRDLTLESEVMKHCVGTSDLYLENLINKKILLIRYDKVINGEVRRGTAEVAIYKEGTNADFPKLNLVVKQFRGFRNKYMGREAKDDLLQFLKSLEDSSFGQYLLHEATTSEYTVAVPDLPF